MKTLDLLLYMDGLRYDRKLTQETYLHEIISQRQYYRYLYGESEPSFEVVVDLSKRLGLSVDRLITNYQIDKENIRNEVREYFNAVVNKENDKAQDLFLKLSKVTVIDDISKMFLKIGYNLFLYNNLQISKLELVMRLKKIIHYEKLIKNDFLQDIETYILGLIMEYSNDLRNEILDRFITLSRENKLYTFGNRLYQSQTFFFIVKNLGRQDKLDELILFSTKAVNSLKKEYSTYLIADIIYYKALAYYKMHRIQEFESELYECINYLRLQTQAKYLQMKAMILKDTGYNIDFFPSICREKNINR